MDNREIFKIWEEAVHGVAYPIISAPPGRRVLLWWTPKGKSNPHAEQWIAGTVCGDGEPGKYWHGNGTTEAEGYGELERITYWTPLPLPPPERAR